MKPLPEIMVAPNGAHKTKLDHPALPITIAEIVDCAVQCYAAGATGIHAHVRDKSGQHVLDVGLYAELIAELNRVVPDMQIQITTEAIGQYSPAEQRTLVEELQPRSVSIALREILEEANSKLTQRFFAYCNEANIAVQYILYDADDIDRLAAQLSQGTIKDPTPQVLHVLGRYTATQTSSPADLEKPLDRQQTHLKNVDWAVCAFGIHETACLVQAAQRGGKIRIGFENNLMNDHGALAEDNAARVAELVNQLKACQLYHSSSLAEPHSAAKA